MTTLRSFSLTGRRGDVVIVTRCDQPTGVQWLLSIVDPDGTVLPTASLTAGEMRELLAGVDGLERSPA